MRYKRLGFFRDTHGNTVLYQQPNLPVILFLVFGALSLVLDGSVSSFFAMLAYGFGLAWAYNEATSGVNGFRKTLGYGVLAVLVIYAILKSF